jgi:hypothetical protein
MNERLTSQNVKEIVLRADDARQGPGRAQRENVIPRSGTNGQQRSKLPQKPSQKQPHPNCFTSKTSSIATMLSRQALQASLRASARPAARPAMYQSRFYAQAAATPDSTPPIALYGVDGTYASALVSPPPLRWPGSPYPPAPASIERATRAVQSPS